jgi:integrase
LRQAYRLLAGIFNEAVRKGLLPSNPCTIKGAGTATAPERELFSVDDIYDIADRVSGCMRCLILTAYWAHLRPGEAIATRRMDWDLEAGKVHVVRQQIDIKRAVLDQMRADGDLPPDLVVLEIPKSQQRRDSHGIDVPIEKNLKWDSQRHIHVPQPGLDVVAEHLAHSPPGFPTARLFTRADGTLLRTGYIDRVWSSARTAAGLPGIRFYDHRHTGLTKASDYGSTKEVMRRGGHSTTRAAMIYQHADAERDKEVARQIGDDFLQRRRKRRATEGDSASEQ